MLHNGGHADSKDRVGEKTGSEDRGTPFSPTPQSFRMPGKERADRLADPRQMAVCTSMPPTKRAGLIALAASNSRARAPLVAWV
jgi:hypothetical protein